MILAAAFLPLSTRVIAVQFRPDWVTPWGWTEAAVPIKAFFRRDYKPSGSIHMYVKNEGRKPLKLRGALLDGEALPALERPGPMGRAHRVVWWRLLPDPIPPEGVAEAIVRLREAPKGAMRLALEFEGGEKVEAVVEPRLPPFRIGSVGFHSDMRKVFLCLEKLTEGALSIRGVYIDGRVVTGRARVLAPRFFKGLCPIVLELKEPLKEGSYHTFLVSALDGNGRKVMTASTVRAFDGFVPLGTYGYKDFDEFARNGLNTYVCFGRLSKRDLDALQMLGMRGISALDEGGGPVREIVGHPALLAHYLMDEPDVKDYYTEGLPHSQRVGQWAMEMERRAKVCRGRDPERLTYLVVNKTYKPANWFVYGEIPDILATDPYALAHGEEPSWVAEVTRTAWEACRPRPLVVIVQAWWFEPKDKRALERQRFPRPPFPGEERQMMLYAIGSGARGLVTYIHCTERPKGGISHGAGEYPDLWAEVGRVYREMETVAPLLSMAHPANLAKSDEPNLWLKTLICGGEALLLVGVNRACKSLRHDFKIKPLKGVKVRVPEIPWLDIRHAYLVGEGRFKPLRVLRERGDILVEIGEVEVGFVVLLAEERELSKRLSVRFREVERKRAEGLLRLWRVRQEERARYAFLRRIIPARYGKFMVVGKVRGGYGIERKEFWNPTGEKWNGFAWYTGNPKDREPRGAFWEVEITADRVGKPQVFLVCAHPFRGATFRVMDEEGRAVVVREFSGPEGVYDFEVTFPRPGRYRLEVVEEGVGSKGCRVSKAAFLVPKRALSGL